MPCHLPESYVDAVLSYQAQGGKEEHPVANALFGWVLPASLFVQNADSEEEQSSDEKNKQNGNQRVETQDHIIESHCKVSKKLQKDIDEESVQTQSTAESNDWDWDSCDDDWDDTLSSADTISCCEDEELLAGEKVYDDWLSVTTLDESDYDEDGEGDAYFAPSPEDFPQIRVFPQLPVLEPKHADREERVDSPSEVTDFWAETRRNLDNILSSTDRVIKELLQHGDDFCKKLTQRESGVNKVTKKSQPAEKKAAKAITPSRSLQHVISMRRVPSLNEVAKVQVKKATKKAMMVKSQTHDNLAQYFNAAIEGNACRSMDGAQNKLTGSREHYDKAKYAPKQTMRPPSGKKRSKVKMSKGNSVPTKPTHRRTRSQRLIPSALDHNDFPWY